MRVVIDRERCIGCGLCYILAPRVFRYGEDGYAELAAGGFEGEVPDELAEEVRRGMRACPTKAIILKAE